MSKKFIYNFPNLHNAHVSIKISQPDVNYDCIELEIDSFFMDGLNNSLKMYFNTLEEFSKFKDMILQSFIVFQNK